MAVERMVGTPWHVEKMVRQDGDQRRHRSRCIYYRKPDSYCFKVCGKCRGAAHCNYYEEHTVVEEEIPEQKQERKLEEFEGVKMIFMSDICVKNILNCLRKRR